MAWPMAHNRKVVGSSLVSAQLIPSYTPGGYKGKCRSIIYDYTYDSDYRI